jgi:hypothetical protein
MELFIKTSLFFLNKFVKTYTTYLNIKLLKYLSSCLNSFYFFLQNLGIIPFKFF